MFWQDKSEQKLRETFFRTAHGVSGECIRVAEAQGIPFAAVDPYEPNGLTLAFLYLHWAAKKDTNRRDKLLYDLVAAYPEQIASHTRDVVARKGENGKPYYDHLMAESEAIKSSFYRHFDRYKVAISQDEMRIAALHPKVPTIAFNQTALAFTPLFIKDSQHMDSYRGLAIWISLVIVQLRVRVSELANG